MQNIIVPDAIYPSDNAWDIPSLRLDMQASVCEAPVVCFGEQKRTLRMEGQGILHFYTDDYRFSKLYDRPEIILVHNPSSIVEPNYTVPNEMATALGMRYIYQKRQIARLMQDKGIRVFVDLNVSNKFYAYNFLGVPKGWSAFATRGYANRLTALEFEWSAAKVVSAGNPLTFLVYGGGETIKEWCKSHKCIYIHPLIRIKEKQRAIAEMAANTDISLFAEDPEMHINIPSLVEMMKNQIADYRNTCHY